MVDDHTKLNDQMKPIASHLGVTQRSQGAQVISEHLQLAEQVAGKVETSVKGSKNRHEVE